MDPLIFILLIYILPYVVWFVIVLAMAMWVYNDAKRNNMDAGIWAIIVFFVGVIGIIVYWIMREEHRKPKVYYMPVGYYPPPGYMPPPYYGPPPAQAPPPAYGSTDFICPDCGRAIKNPYRSRSLFCESCGSTHQVH